MIYKVRKKEVLTACKWIGNNYKEVQEFLGYMPHTYKEAILIGPLYDQGFLYPDGYIIKNQNGEVYIRNKDWIEQDYEIISS